ncbi:MAG: hypothetical protein ACXW20_03990 [Burkholderiales bacterium]
MGAFNDNVFKVEPGLLPLGAIGLTIFGIDLRAKSQRARIAFAHHRGQQHSQRAIIVAAAALAIVLFQFGFTIPQLVLVTALLNAAVALYIFTLVPEFLMRFMAWALIHSVYRLEKGGIERIPAGEAQASSASPETLRAAVAALRGEWR